MDIEYHLIRSDRRSIGIEVDREGKVTVRAPYSCEKKRIDRFLLEKENWIRQKVKLQKENAMKRQEKREMPEAEKKYYRNLAREVLGARTGYYARKMGVTYGRISIRSVQHILQSVWELRITALQSGSRRPGGEAAAAWGISITTGSWC